MAVGTAAPLEQRFLERIVTFARLLRDNGFVIGQREVADAARAVAAMGDMREPALRRLMRPLFCTRAPERARFDELFDAYWLGQAGRRRTRLEKAQAGRKRGAGAHGADAPAGGAGLLAYFDWAPDGAAGAEEQGAAQDGETRRGGASGRGSALKADFGRTSDPDERERLLALAERLGARLRYRIARRRKARIRGRALHVRRTVRASVGAGGLPIRLVRKVKREPPVSIVLFVDVSGSMDAYSLFFTRFAHALLGGFARAEVFIFHTKLVRVTTALREADPVKMMEKLTLISQGWSGGTRIGAALGDFNRHYAEAALTARSVAIIMSDGYDTGGVEELGAEMKRLKRRCHKLIWLNPLLGRAAYAPVASRMVEARRHVDLFAPAHNLASLLKLEDALVRI